MAAPRKYPDELRERATRMAVEARKDPATRPGALARIGGQLGINPETLRNWVNQAEIDAGSRPGTTTTDAERLAELEREVQGAAPGERDLAVGVGFLRGGARPPQPLIVDYVDQHKSQFGVEPICAALTSADVKIAPSTYYASKQRPPSARAVHDEQLKVEIARVHKENYGVYGIRKMHAQLAREGVLGASGQRPVARCTTQRLMKDLGLRGISRAKGPRTTVPGSGPDTRPDLVERQFTADAPDQLWVADITYCRTFAGWVYAAFVARRVQPPRRRLAAVHLAAHRPGPRRAQHGPVGPGPRRARHQRAGPSLRPRRAVPRRPLHRTPRRSRRRRLRRQQGRHLRQRHGRGVQQPVQGRARPQPRPLEEHRRPRDRRRRVHRLVQLPPPARRDRTHPTGRVRGPAPTAPPCSSNPLSGSSQSPSNPVLDISLRSPRSGSGCCWAPASTRAGRWPNTAPYTRRSR